MFKQASMGPYNTNVTIGDDILVYCTPYANPTATASWFINGVPFNPAGKVLLLSDSKLLLIVEICQMVVDHRNCGVTVTTRGA